MSNSKLEVIYSIRNSAKISSGGDLILARNYYEYLKNVDIDTQFSFDENLDFINSNNSKVVHLFNATLNQDLLRQSLYYKNQKAKIVISPLYENWPIFLHQQYLLGNLLIQYVQSEQKKLPNLEDCLKIEKAQAPNAIESFILADAILLSGKEEQNAIFQQAEKQLNAQQLIELKQKIHIIPSAMQQKNKGMKDRFYKKYGLVDFCLCVGRIELRKNQLALCAALEELDIPIVLISNPINYHPEYVHSVKNFRRKGKVIILPFLDEQDLNDCYAAAALHALPSWYELPGLVTLEAAWQGIPVVCSRGYGTIEDYLSTAAVEYCLPYDLNSIKQAVLNALNCSDNKKNELSYHLQQFSWSNHIQRIILLYEALFDLQKNDLNINKSLNYQKNCNMTNNARENNFQFSKEGIITNNNIELAEKYAKEHNFNQAIELFQNIITEENHDIIRAYRGLGSVYLANSQPFEAKEIFTIALDRIEKQGVQKDEKILTGLGMSYIQLEKLDKARFYLLEALKIKIDNVLALHQLLFIAHKENRFDYTIEPLATFCQDFPNHIEMRFCYSAALYHNKKYDEANYHNNLVLQQNSSHEGAVTLRKQIKAILNSDNNNLENNEKVFQSNTTKVQNVLSEEFLIQFEAWEDLKRKKDFTLLITEINQFLEESFTANANERCLALCLKAESLVLLKEIEEGKRICNLLLSSFNDIPRILCFAGALKGYEGDWNKAKEYFDQALQITPNYDLALAGIGACYHQEGSLENAWNYYELALNTSIECKRALLGIIELGYSLKKLNKLEFFLTEYVSLHPADFELRYALAGCYYAQEKTVEAKEEIEKILIFNPNYEKALELNHLLQAQM